MPSDIPPRLVRPSPVKSFQEICDQVMLLPGEKRVYTTTRWFATGYITGFDAIEVSIVVAKLQRRGLLVDYGTEMTSRVCRDYIIIREVLPELKAEAKLLK